MDPSVGGGCGEPFRQPWLTDKFEVKGGDGGEGSLQAAVVGGAYDQLRLLRGAKGGEVGGEVTGLRLTVGCEDWVAGSTGGEKGFGTDPGHAKAMSADVDRI